MFLSTGGNATLASGNYSDDVILPILGELKEIIKKNADIFDVDTTGRKIKELLNDYINDAENTADLPWVSLRWANEVKSKSIQVKFIASNSDIKDFSLMQFYNNSRGIEGMIYVAKYLIEKVK